MQALTFKEHFFELKSRLYKVLFIFIFVFIACYYFSDYIYNLLLEPLATLEHGALRSIIYTGLTEAFFTYLKLAAFSSFIITMPVLALEIYLFIHPGLHKNEKKIAAFIVLISPILFWLGSIFVYYYVMPRAWQFFLSFENETTLLPIVLEARISEYLNLVIQLIFAFGIAFQMPIIILILNLLDIVTIEFLQHKRRFAIVINFIIAGVLTPPDVISQFALAIPMLLLYEVSILMCKIVKNRGKNVGYKMD